MVKWDLVSFISRGKRRKQILPLLKKPTTPTEIADKINVSVTHVSRTLKHLKEKGLVKCLTPEERVWKLYQLIKEGSEVLDYLEKEK